MPYIILSTCLNSNFYVVRLHFAWSDSFCFLVWSMSNALGYCGHKTGSLFGAKDHFLSFFGLCKTCNFLALQIPTLTSGDHKGNFVGSLAKYVISMWRSFWRFMGFFSLCSNKNLGVVALPILWSRKNCIMLLYIHDMTLCNCSTSVVRLSVYLYLVLKGCKDYHGSWLLVIVPVLNEAT